MVLVPYPFATADHQRLNAAPLAEGEAAILLEDHIEPESNAVSLEPVLHEMLTQENRRRNMRYALGTMHTTDGALDVAQWVMAQGI